jgi:pimeloyl-ACP methyl ester carboxylesterase
MQFAFSKWQNGYAFQLGEIMKQLRKSNFLISLMAMIILIFNGCNGTAAVRPNEANYDQSNGKFITQDGYTFSYRYYPAASKGPSVIFIPGMGGRSTWHGSGAYALTDGLNTINVNFIGFDRAGALSSGSQPEHIRNTMKRSKGGALNFPTVDGKESAAQNIVKNEIAALLEFAESSPTHDPQKGVYLIGGSFGAMIALESVASFPDKIKGVIFVSPSILPVWFTEEAQSREAKFDIINHFQSLVKAFGSRPGLAIGSDKDKISTKFPGTSLDGAKFLEIEIGDNIEVLDVDSSLHSWELIGGNKKVRDQIALWLEQKASI